MSSATDRWAFRPVDAERWPDLEALFGTSGAHGGCWCMRWRLPRDRFELDRGEAHRVRLQTGVAAGRFHGMLGYRDDQPVAWCSYGPRVTFPGLLESEVLAPVDDLPVWSVSCFFVSPRARRQGITAALLRAAAADSARLGAKILEGYPLDPPMEKVPVAAGWTGMFSAFLEAGFVEVERRAPARPIVRLDLSAGG